MWCARPVPIEAGTAWLSPKESAKASAFRQDADRRRFVTGRALVRAAVGERLGTAPASVHVRVGPRDGPSPGRPFVDGGPSFSIAHAGRWVLVAVVDGAGGWARTEVSIGVDVESDVPARDHLADLLDALPPQERPAQGWAAESFTRSWVRREAVLKAVGTGLRAPRDDLVLARANDDASIVHSGGVLPAPDRLALRDLELQGDYLAAVAICARPSTRPSTGTPGVTVPRPRPAPARLTFSDVRLADGHELLARNGIDDLEDLGPL